MARVLVRLKLALLAAGLRRAGIQGQLGAALALSVAVAVGGTVGVLLVFTRYLEDRDATDVTCAALAFVLVVWVLGPVVAAASDGTLEPDRLAPFPLSRRQLLPGLLLAALVGFGGVLTVLVVLGAVVGMAPPAPLLPVTIVAAVTQLLLCAAGSRLVATAISGAARSRRWRDLALVVGPLLALSLNLGLQLLTRPLTRTTVGGEAPALGAGRTAARIAGGPSALAIGLAQEGRAVAAVAAAAAGIALLVGVVALWGVVLERALTSGGGNAVRETRAAQPLRPRLTPFLPWGRTGAVAAKDLRLTWRDPRQRVAFASALFGALIPLLSFRVLASNSPRMMLVVALPAFVLGTQATNQFGFDGPAWWVSVATADDPRPELLGKNLARLVPAVPLIGLALVLLGARAGSATFVLPAAGLAAAAFGIALGLGNWFSVTAAVPLPDTATNVFSAGNTGQGLAAAGPALAVLFGGGLLVVPLVLPMVVVDDVVVLQVLGLVGIVVGGVAWRIGLRAAANHLRPRQPELLARLSER